MGGSLSFLGNTKAELLTLQQLRCVVAAARLGSFTRAADALDVSQPAVAEQVRNLEATLGIDLFARAGRGVRPTQAGETFAERAAAVLAALDDAVATVDAIADMDRGTLAFGLFATPEAYAIDRLASGFAQQHPAIAVRLVGRNSSIVADRVRRGELEAALVTLPIDDAGLDVRPFARDEVVYVSADLERARAPITIEDLVRRPLVIYDAESGDRDPLRRQLQQRAQELGLRLEPRMETETMVMALRLVADGVGDTFVPRAHTRAAYFPAGLSIVGFDPLVHETFAVVSRTGGRPSPVTRAFVDLLVAHLTSPELGLEHL
jgi:DNA-binding transcriptional LysR family regulator